MSTHKSDSGFIRGCLGFRLGVGWAKHPIAARLLERACYWRNYSQFFTPVRDTLRILVAEDDENDLVLLQVAFSKVHLAAPVNIVRDGQELMDYLEGVSPYDDREKYPKPTLLLLDLGMPRRNGFEVLEWLLWYPKLRPKHIVVLTASDYGDDIRRIRLLGADAHLVKPQDLNELVQLVKWLEQYWLEAEESERRRELAAHPS